MLMRLFTILAVLAGLAAAGCNSTESTLQPTTGDTAANVDSNEPEAMIPGVRIAIAPVVGAPVEPVAVLTKRLSLRAKERGLRLVRSTEGTETHVLKGYFSAFVEGSATTVIYVWDILDMGGNRLHRFQGQENTPANSASDAWASVPPETMERIADQTAQALAAWFAGNSG